MKLTVPIFVATLAGAAYAQQGNAPQPPLLACGSHDGIEILCGTHSPEDLELTPDGKFLIVSQFVNNRNGATGAGLGLLDLAAKSYSKLPVRAEPNKDWGDPSCPGPIGDALVPHGISLSKRANGAMQLYVVNHGGRESMEMFELKRTGGNWEAVWRGCVVAAKDYNDVATLPDGSYIATHPTALRAQGDTSDLFAGQPSGYVSRWTPGKGESELPGTRAGYPNGILVTADGHYMYFNAWTAREVHKYDLKESKEVGMVKLNFLPDNITWTKKHQMLAAGIKSARGNCPASSDTPCRLTFGVAQIDPAKMAVQKTYDSEGKGASIGGVSVALQAGNDIYVGSFQGDRLVKMAWKE